jgi:hypothetical protein
VKTPRHENIDGPVGRTGVADRTGHRVSLDSSLALVVTCSYPTYDVVERQTDKTRLCISCCLGSTSGRAGKGTFVLVPAVHSDAYTDCHASHQASQKGRDQAMLFKCPNVDRHGGAPTALAVGPDSVVQMQRRSRSCGRCNVLPSDPGDKRVRLPVSGITPRQAVGVCIENQVRCVSQPFRKQANGYAGILQQLHTDKGQRSAQRAHRVMISSSPDPVGRKDITGCVSGVR